MERITLCPSISNRKNYWPLARLLLVLLIFGLWVRFRLGAVALPAAKGGATILILLFCFFAFVSSLLAQLYTAIVIFPFYAVTLLNEWLYEGMYWVFRTALRLFYMRRVSAVVAFLGELGIFAALWWLTKTLIRRYFL